MPTSPMGRTLHTQINDKHVQDVREKLGYVTQTVGRSLESSKRRLAAVKQTGLLA